MTKNTHMTVYYLKDGRTNDYILFKETGSKRHMTFGSTLSFNIPLIDSPYYFDTIARESCVDDLAKQHGYERLGQFHTQILPDNSVHLEKLQAEAHRLTGVFVLTLPPLSSVTPSDVHIEPAKPHGGRRPTEDAKRYKNIKNHR